MKLAVIGTKFISDLFIEAAVKTGAYELECICSRSAERGKQYQERFGFRRAVRTVSEAAADPDVEIVYVATPNTLHYEHAKICLENGKHVIVEKPSFENTEQLKELLALASAKNVYLFEAMRSIHNPDLQTIKNSLARAGEIRYAHFSLMRDFRAQIKDNGGELTPVFLPQFAGGCNYHLGIYGIMAALHLLGKPEEVFYKPVLLESGVDGTGVCVLKYRTFLCTVASSLVCAADSVNFIEGDLGKVSFDYVVTPHNAAFETGSGSEPIPLLDAKDDMFYEANDFARIAKECDEEAYRSLTEEMQTLLQILETCRQQAGIRFPQDAMLER